jgi:hypothetical protein
MNRKLLLLAIPLFLTQVVKAQDTRLIRFRDDNPGQRILHYYIADVQDHRKDTTSLGTLKTGLLGKKTAIVNFENGAATSIRQYVQKNYQQNTALTPAVLHINEMDIKELPGGLRTKVELHVNIAFYIEGNKTMDYSGNAEVLTMGDVFKHIEDVIRQHLRNTLKEFDGFWDKNRMLYEKGAPIKLQIELVNTSKDDNQVGYAINRPLMVNDFIATPDELSRAAAQTASAIQVKYLSGVDSAQIKVQVMILPYFDKSRSWFLAKHQRNAAILKHEQGHFDITALKACELADTLQQQQLTKANYQEKLEQIQAQKQRELNNMQILYDSETRHGTNIPEQQKWDKLLKELLAARPCYR